MRAGGNMDIRQLTAGSTLFLPVLVPGALFSVGDAHGAQGDGEVSGTAIEMDATVTLHFDLMKGRNIPGPQLRTPGSGTVAGPRFAAVGHHPDLYEASREALRSSPTSRSTTASRGPRRVSWQAPAWTCVSASSSTRPTGRSARSFRSTSSRPDDHGDPGRLSKTNERGRLPCYLRASMVSINPQGYKPTPCTPSPPVSGGRRRPRRTVAPGWRTRRSCGR